MAMMTNRRRKAFVAYSLIAPFVITFLIFFLYPTLSVLQLSFTNAPLIGEGEWVGLANYKRLFSDRLFYTSVKNNGYFVLLTVILLPLALATNQLGFWLVKKVPTEAFYKIILVLMFVVGLELTRGGVMGLWHG